MSAPKLRAAVLVFLVGFSLGLSVFAASRLLIRSLLTSDAIATAENLAERLAEGSPSEAVGTISSIARFALFAPDGTVAASGSNDTQPVPDLSGAQIEALARSEAPSVSHSPLAQSLFGLTDQAVQNVAVPVIGPDGSRLGTLFAEIDQRNVQDSLGRAFSLVAIGAIGLAVLGFVALAFSANRRQRGEPRRKVLDLGSLPRDPLTRFLSRQGFERALSDAVETASRNDASLGLMVIDIDGLRSANNVWGHATGDQLLCAVADRLRKFVQGDGKLARIGGDEFALIVQGDANPHSLRDLARRMTGALAAPYEIDGRTIILGASAGIGLYPVNAENATLLFRAADVALARAKAEGRQAIRFFDTEMQQEMKRRTELERDLRTALEKDEFVVFYQPQLELASGKLRGYEALVRWERPGQGIIAPADFLPVAEETGLIRPLGEWVLRKACRDAVSWLDAGTVAVNFSRSQFRGVELDQTISAVLTETGLPPERLEIEVPESLFLEHAPDVMANLRRIKALGVRVAMDDFGAGYSSLASLASFPFDRIKIDRSFVAQLVDDREVAAIVSSIVGLGRSLSVDITAEGVESSEQVTMLKAAGCSTVQGFLFGAPQRTASAPASEAQRASAG